MNKRLLHLYAFCLIAGLAISCRSGQKQDRANDNDARIKLADSLNYTDPKAADSIYDIVLKDSSKSNQVAFIKALKGLADVFSNQGNFDTANILLVRAKDISIEISDTLLMMRCYLGLGNLNIELNNEDAAEVNFTKGMELATACQNEDNKHSFAISLGNLYIGRGDYTKAATTLNAGMLYAEKTGNLANKATILFFQSRLAGYTDDYEEAIRLIKQSLQLKKKLGLTRDYAAAVQNLGIYYRNLDKIDSALIAYHEAYDIFSELSDTVNMVMVRYNIANILKNQGKYTLAESEMNQVLEICRQKGLKSGQIYAMSALAAICEETGRKEAGVALITKAIEEARQLGLINDLSRLYNRQHELLASVGRYPEAYKSALLSQNISDSLVSVEKQKEIIRLKTSFETARKESENALLRKDIEIQKSKLAIHQTSIAIGALLFLMMVAFFYTRQKRLKHEQHLEEEKSLRLEQENRNKHIELEKAELENRLKKHEIEQMRLQNEINEAQIEKLELSSGLKEQELVFQALVRAELTQVLHSVEEKLLPFNMKFTRKKDQESFMQALGDITRNSNVDPLSEFEVLFRQLHPGFYEKMLTRCPSISKSELQMSAMIRLNLSSKDIARLVNLSISTIETTRYHIRKKLDLDPKDNLTVYLMTV